MNIKFVGSKLGLYFILQSKRFVSTLCFCSVSLNERTSLIIAYFVINNNRVTGKPPEASLASLNDTKLMT
jgi:hypothetical protein